MSPNVLKVRAWTEACTVVCHVRVRRVRVMMVVVVSVHLPSK